MRIVLTLVLVSLVLISCSSPQPDLAVIKKTVEEFDAASTDAMITGNLDKVMTYYASDAVSMPPNMGMLNGSEAIKSWMAEMSKSGMKMTSVNFTTMQLDASGKVAFQLGTYDMAMEMPGMGAMKDNGKYVSIWKQHEDGTWKVHAEIWNSSVPLPKAEAPKKETKKDVKKAPKKGTTKASTKTTKTPAKK